MKKNNHFYITTPIYYVTAKPHLGSLYSTLLADVFARWHAMRGSDVFFLTGTDEHGQKIQQAAAEAGKDPQSFVDGFIPAYKEAWHRYEIEFSHFVRTTSPEHIKGAQQFVKLLLEKGDIYKDIYSGWYCTPCETFVTGKDNEGGQDVPACPTCGRGTLRVQEETYFFRLSAYQDKLLKFYKNNPDFIVPQERGNEVITFIEAGLKDLSISRTTVSWGVPFPDSPDHTIYVWVEALCNYITAIGYGDSHRADEFARWWPADVQVIGKDIIRFHGIFWPAFLMAAELPFPKHLLVHGWIKIDKQKMSKSLGNVIDPMVLADTYGVDAVRYYLCRQMPINQDGDFSIKDLEERITADLANDLGNLLNRVLKLAQKYDLTVVDAPSLWDQEALALRDAGWDMFEKFTIHMNEMYLHHALGVLWNYIHKVNGYFHAKEPWKQAAKDRPAFNATMSAACHGLRMIALLAFPVMPRKMNELLMALGMNYKASEKSIADLDLDVWHHRFELVQTAPLFDLSAIVKLQEERAAVQQNEKKEDTGKQMEQSIDITDLMKVELVVGSITQCEEIKGSSKLYKLMVDCGSYGKRQILSGIRASFAPTDLIDKQATFVLNLKPRMMMGMESHGMMLVAENAEGKVELVMPERAVPNGTRLR